MKGHFLLTGQTSEASTLTSNIPPQGGMEKQPHSSQPGEIGLETRKRKLSETTVSHLSTY
jgi:hypothetical protein